MGDANGKGGGRGGEGRERVCEVVGQIATRWCEGVGRDRERTECTVWWDEGRERVRWTEWKALEPLPERGRRYDDVFD